MTRVMFFSALGRTRADQGQRTHMNCIAVHIAASALFVPYERDRSDRTNIVRSDPDRFGSVLPDFQAVLGGEVHTVAFFCAVGFVEFLKLYHDCVGAQVGERMRVLFN